MSEGATEKQRSLHNGVAKPICFGPERMTYMGAASHYVYSRGVCDQHRGAASLNCDQYYRGTASTNRMTINRGAAASAQIITKEE